MTNKHAGITRAPVFTTFTQVFTRCVQVWAIDYGYPQLITGLGASVYAAMLSAWALADVVRYSYFVVMLAGGLVPAWLKWLRYSLFYVLYPVGIGGEWFLMYGAAREEEGVLKAVYYFCLALYVPGKFSVLGGLRLGDANGCVGAIMMYSYMVKQRRKTLSGRGR